jgi:hypothetical protein
MRWLLGVLLISACLPEFHAATRIYPKRFYGERWVTVLGPEDDVAALSRMLEDSGVRVAHRPPGDTSTPITPYVITSDGVCGGGWSEPTLRVQLIARERQDLVFEATVQNATGCPETFFRDAVIALMKAWPQ